MSAYLDASVLVALFTNDPFSAAAESYFKAGQQSSILSDFAAAEFASAVGRRVRMGELSRAEGLAAFANLDLWAVMSANPVNIASSDIAAAQVFLRRLDLTLRTQDAIHIAVARRMGAPLATFDRRMQQCARNLDLPLVSLD